MNVRSLRFIGEQIEVEFDEEPKFEKKPDCPDRLIWADQTHSVLELLAQWHDYTRRGRMAVNMRSTHLATASLRGSWGVGRFFFRVRVESGRIFDIYYDRAPGKASERKGCWYLWREMTADPVADPA
jgi:hypothetical protein